MLSYVTFFTKFKLIRYLLAGGTGATVHLGLVYILTHILDVWYLYATSAAFLVALVVSFTLQKFWTFQNTSREHIRKQGSVYAAVSTVNLFLNGVLMVLLVERLDLVPVVAQFFTSALISTEAFVVYSVIFREVVDGDPALLPGDSDGVETKLE